MATQWRIANGIWCVGIAATLIFSGISTRAAEAGRLNAALAQMEKLELEPSTGRTVSGLTLSQTNFSLTMTSGRLVFARPVQLDTTSKYYAAFFSGGARVQFAPPVTMEQQEVHRFFGNDSLDRQVESAVLLFNDKFYQELIDSTVGQLFSPNKDDLSDYRNFRERLTEREDYRYLFAALKNLVRPRTQPFLTVLMKLKDGGTVMYQFDPYQREEVRLSNHHEEFIVSHGMETVCQYSVYLDSTYEQLNGIDKTALRADAYALTGMLEDDGDYTGRAEMACTGEMAGTQLVELSLHPRLEVDSVRDGENRVVHFRRWTKDEHRSAALWVILNQPLNQGETTRLSFYYHGKLGARHMGRLQTFAGADWYPRYERTQKAIFNIALTFPAKYQGVVAAQFVDSTRAGRLVTTRWQVTQPQAAVSFDVGEYERFLFMAPEIPPVVVYHLAALHRDSAGRMMDQPMAEDIPESEGTVSGESDTYDPKSSKDSVVLGREARKLTKSFVLDLLTGERSDSPRESMKDDPIRVGGKQMERQVAEDIMASLRLFSASLGQLPYDTVRVVETMTPMDEVVPGVIHLGWDTFFSTDRYGSERARRGRGVALQWFGGLINYETYHDQWLSDGLSTYCGMWYLQTAVGQGQFLSFVDQARKEIISLSQYTLGQRQDPGPVALGYRTATSKSAGDMDVIVYLKGAYVLHMLRHMLLDLENLREDTYLATMRDYVTLLRNKDATTELFRQVIERHAGQDMRWFFRQWVYGSDIPKYTVTYTTRAGEGSAWVATGQISSSGIPEHFKMYFPIEIEFDGEGRWYARIEVNQPSVTFEFPTLPSEPRHVIANPFGSVLAESEVK